MRRWISLGSWCGPTLILSKLGVPVLKEKLPFDVARCTLDGILELTERGFDEGYFPGPVGARPFVPDPVSIWLLFRSKHACFTHFDLNADEAIAELERRIGAWKRLLSPVVPADASSSVAGGDAVSNCRSVTFLRTILAENAHDEIELIPRFHKTIHEMTKGTLSFRTVLIMHEQGLATQPVCKVLSDSGTSSWGEMDAPCILWNLKRNQHTKLHERLEEPAIVAHPEEAMRRPSLLEEYHDGYQHVITTMSKENKWRQLIEGLPTYSQYVQARLRNVGSEELLRFSISSSPDPSLSSSIASIFKPYTELSRVEGTPAMRGTCRGFGSSANKGRCAYCGSTDGHAVIARNAFDTHKPWREEHVDQLLLAYALNNGDEVAAVESVALEQRRGANETWCKLQELLDTTETKNTDSAAARASGNVAAQEDTNESVNISKGAKGAALKKSKGGYLHDKRIFESWLEKKAEWRFAWDKRFFTLDSNRLAYHTDENTPEKKWGTVASLDCNISKNDFVFRVWLLEGDSWTLRAANGTLYEEWLHYLLTALQGSNPVTSPALPALFLPATLTPEPAPSTAESASNLQDGTNSFRFGGNEDSSIAPPRTPATSGGPINLAATAPDADCPARTPVWGSILLQADVEKRTTWTGRWKMRNFELTDGYQLVYRLKPNGAVRQHYTITALDFLEFRFSNEPSYVNRLLLFSTSTKEKFWVRFHTPEERDTWYHTIYVELRARCSWQCMPLLTEASPSLLFLSYPSAVGRILGERAADYDALHVHHHCAALAPCPGGGATALYVFGGSKKWCTPCFQPQTRALMESATSDKVSQVFLCLLLTGTHVLHMPNLEPFEERQHVKTRPAARYGASLTALLPHGAMAADGGDSVLRLVLFGGLSPWASGLPATEVWVAAISVMEDGPQPRWLRYTLPLHALPTLAFHDALWVSVSDAVNGLHTHRILITGGIDEETHTRAECYLLEYDARCVTLTQTDSGSPPPSPLRVSSLCFLPQPRSHHRCVLLSDETVVLVGGRGTQNADACPLLILPAANLRALCQEHAKLQEQPCYGSEDVSADASSSPWLQVHWDNIQGPLPPLPDVAVELLPTRASSSAALPMRERLVILAELYQSHHQVKLYVVELSTWSEPSDEMGAQLPQYVLQGKWLEITLRVGAVPRRVVGATIHVHQGYIYVLGCGGNTIPSGSASSEEKVELCGPMRILMDDL